MPATRGSSNRPRRLFALAAVLALCFSLVLPAPAAAVMKIGISTPTFDFNVAPGQSGSGELWVINDGTEPFSCMVYSADQVLDKQGHLTYEVPKYGSSRLTNPASWLQVKMPEDSKAIGNVPYVEMKPKDRVLVKFDFQVPKGVPPGDHQLLLFFEMFEFPTDGGMTAKVTGRVASRIKIRVQGKYVEGLDVRPMAVQGLVIGDLLPYSFTVRNDGNLDEEVNGKLSIIDGNEEVRAGSDVVSERTVFARASIDQTGTLALKGIGLGKYTARLVVTHPSLPNAKGATTSKQIVKERVVWVVPLWMAIAAAVLLAAILLRVVWYFAVRAAKKSGEKEGNPRASRAWLLPWRKPAPQKE